MSKKNLFWVVLVVALVLAQSLRERSLVSGKAPLITAQVFNQKSGALENPQEPSLIYFWASWCGTCKAIQGTIQAILQEYPGVTIAMKSGNKQAVSRYLAAQSLDWPYVVDEQGGISAEFGVPGVPAIFILDSNGYIRFTSIGYSSPWGLRLRLWLAGFE